MQGADVGLDPWSPGSHPGLKAGAQPLSHPGCPQHNFKKKSKMRSHVGFVYMILRNRTDVSVLSYMWVYKHRYVPWGDVAILHLSTIFLNILFIHGRHRERERKRETETEAETQAEGEASSRQGA